MWPDKRGGGFYKDPYPDCRDNGPHRYTKAHPWPVDGTIFYQTCRRCGRIRFTKIKIKNGITFVEDITPPDKNSGHKEDTVSDGIPSPKLGEDVE